MKHVSRMAPICLLFLCLSLSGCGTFFDCFLRNRVEEAACRSQCSGLKEHDYRHCVRKCMSDTSLERSEWKHREKKEKEQIEATETEQSEFDKRLNDMLLKGREK